jgi:hypothetical protein
MSGKDFFIRATTRQSQDSIGAPRDANRKPSRSKQIEFILKKQQAEAISSMIEAFQEFD